MGDWRGSSEGCGKRGYYRNGIGRADVGKNVLGVSGLLELLGLWGS